MNRRAVLAIGGIAVAAAAAIAAVLVTSGSSRPAPAPAAPADVGVARFAKPQLVQTYLAAATSDIAAVTSYDYRRLDDALASGLAVSTGAYAQRYRSALSGAAAAHLESTHAVSDFTLQYAGIGEMAADGSHAAVLVFGVQVQRDDSGRHANPVALTATIERDGDRYPISALAADTNAGIPPGTAGLAAAAEAARSGVAARVGPVLAVAVQAAGGRTATIMVVASHGRRVLRYVITVGDSGGRWAVAGSTAVAPYR